MEMDKLQSKEQPVASTSLSSTLAHPADQRADRNDTDENAESKPSSSAESSQSANGVQKTKKKKKKNIKKLRRLGKKTADEGRDERDLRQRISDLEDKLFFYVTREMILEEAEGVDLSQLSPDMKETFDYYTNIRNWYSCDEAIHHLELTFN